jgi:hypothetical protein
LSRYPVKNFLLTFFSKMHKNIRRKKHSGRLHKISAVLYTLGDQEKKMSKKENT